MATPETHVSQTAYIIADRSGLFTVRGSLANESSYDAGGGRGYISVLVRDIELLQQQQRAADSGSMSEKVPGNLHVQAGSF